MVQLESLIFLNNNMVRHKHNVMGCKMEALLSAPMKTKGFHPSGKEKKNHS